MRCKTYNRDGAAPTATPIGFAAPATFVLLWSTGFVGAKFGLPYAEPMTFLAYRFWLAAALLALFTIAVSAPPPRRSQLRDLVLVGVLVHAGYLGGVYVAIAAGVEAGTAALIAGLQPIATAALARVTLGERLSARQSIGMTMGAAGVALVVLRKLGDGVGEPWAVAVCVAATLAIAFGSVFQKKRLADAPMASGNVVQFASAAAAATLFAVLFETGEVRWTLEFVAALGWLVFVLSAGAVTLLYLLLRRGEASTVSSLFFLVPPVAALMGWAMFGERLGPVEIAGVACASLGVALVTIGRPAPGPHPKQS